MTNDKPALFAIYILLDVLSDAARGEPIDPETCESVADIASQYKAESFTADDLQALYDCGPKPAPDLDALRQDVYAHVSYHCTGVISPSDAGYGAKLAIDHLHSTGRLTTGADVQALRDELAEEQSVIKSQLANLTLLYADGIRDQNTIRGLQDAVRGLADAHKRICHGSAYEIDWESDGNDYFVSKDALQKHAATIKACEG